MVWNARDNLSQCVCVCVCVCVHVCVVCVAGNRYSCCLFWASVAASQSVSEQCVLLPCMLSHQQLLTLPASEMNGLVSHN